MASVNDQVFEMWKQQAELGMRVADAMVQASAKLWTAQFEAMSELNCRMLQCLNANAQTQGEASAEKAPLALTVPGDLALRLWNDMYRQVDTFTRSFASAAVPAADEGKKQEQPGA
ncbi:MAG: hypothetical protein AB1452_16935 [Pseudomonadota bacterium]